MPRHAAAIQLGASLAMGLLLAGLARYLFLRKRAGADLGILGPPGGQNRRGPWLTGLLVVVALATGFNYFYSSRNNGKWIHRHDLYHSFFASKYYEELGYFGLYECTLALGQEDAPRRFRRVKRVRDLKTHNFYSKKKHDFSKSGCAERFTPERRAAFLTDLDRFDEFGTHWKGIFRDKGYNGTPTYTWVLRTLIGNSPPTYARLLVLALLDVFLIIGALFAVAWAYGVRTAALAATFFFVSFPNKFGHMGGSILRFDYIAFTIVALCLVRKERLYALAGVFLSWACFERGFPAVFCVGLGLSAAAIRLYQGAWPRWFFRFCAGFGLASVIIFLISLSVGGLGAWQEWKANMAVHNTLSAGFRIGLRNLFVVGPGNIFTHTGQGHSWYIAAGRNYEHLKWIAWPVVLASLVPAVFAVRRLPPAAFAALFGTFAFFALFIATRYYYSVLVLLFLLEFRNKRDGAFHDWYYLSWLSALFFVSAVGHWAMESGQFSTGFIYNYLYTALTGVAFLALFVWMVRDFKIFARPLWSRDRASSGVLPPTLLETSEPEGANSAA